MPVIPAVGSAIGASVGSRAGASVGSVAGASVGTAVGTVGSLVEVLAQALNNRAIVMITLNKTDVFLCISYSSE
jgi:outer membrane lipoprotein SlyB